MLIGLTSSTAWGGVCLANDGQLLFADHWLRPLNHQEIFTLAINKGLTESGCRLEQVQGIVTDVGPGSFTGIRISVNLARTLAYSLNIPVYPVNSLHLLAESLMPADVTATPALITLDAHKNMFYCAQFQRQHDGAIVAITEPEALTVEDLKQLYESGLPILGEARRLFDSHDIERPLPDPAPLLKQLSRSKNMSDWLSWKELKPVYVRASEPEEKHAQSRVQDK